MASHRLSLPVAIVKQYTADVICRKMAPIQLRVTEHHTIPFPKDRSRLKSFYEYRPRSLSRNRHGQLCGGPVRLVAMLFDFAFTRSIFAVEYSTRGGHCYDPTSLFVLLVFAFVDGYETISAFVKDLHDPYRGHQYRLLAGVDEECIPQEADLSNFIAKCGPLFDQVFHTVVEIVHQAGFISGQALTTDGMLTPTWSRYRGCNYFETDVCSSLTIPENLMAIVQARIEELATDLSAQRPIQGGYVQIECPRWQELVADHPTLSKQKPKKVTLFHLRLYYPLRGLPGPDGPDGREVLRRLGLEVELAQEIRLEVVCGHVVRHEESLHIVCPRVPTDVEARLGVHISPRTGQKEYIFGRDVMTTSSVEVRLGGLTLPVALSLYPANINEGDKFIEHDEQTIQHDFPERVHVLDGAYDTEPNNSHLRSKESLPVIAYNPRRENLKPDALQSRGYDEQGWPFADCGRLMPPVTPLALSGQARHACQRQCQEETSPEKLGDCPYLDHQLGQVKEMSIADHPRLVAEIIRGTPERKKVEGLRSPSESVNSYAQQYTGLKAPRLRGDDAFFARAHLSLLGLLLGKTVDFIIDMTDALHRLLPGQERLVEPPPQSIRQRQLMQWLRRLLSDETET